MPVSVSNTNIFFQSRNFRLPLLLLVWGEMEALFSTLLLYLDRKLYAGSLKLYLQRQKILQYPSALKWKKSICPWYDFLVVGCTLIFYEGVQNWKTVLILNSDADKTILVKNIMKWKLQLLNSEDNKIEMKIWDNFKLFFKM